MTTTILDIDAHPHLLDEVPAPPMNEWVDDATPDLRTNLLPLAGELSLDVQRRLMVTKAWRLQYLRRSGGWGRTFATEAQP